MKKIFFFNILFFALTLANATDKLNASNVITQSSNNNVYENIIIANNIPCTIDTPCYLVKSTSNQVIDALNNYVGQEQRTVIQNIVTPHFDFTLMTKYALGQNWKTANITQQKQLVENFKLLLIYTYSSALSKFKDAKITIINQIITGKKAVVSAKVVIPSTDSNPQPIMVEYDLIKTNDNSWKAYDIKIENASLVTTYRNQFNEVIQTNGINGLILQLKNKVISLKKRKE